MSFDAFFYYANEIYTKFELEEIHEELNNASNVFKPYLSENLIGIFDTRNNSFIASIYFSGNIIEVVSISGYRTLPHYGPIKQ